MMGCEHFFFVHIIHTYLTQLTFYPMLYTIITAPTNDAFAALPEGTVDSLLLPENVDQLTSILTYHVVAADFPSDALVTGSVPTVNGAEVDVVVSDDGITVNGANVVIPDVVASNGIIHAIDAVLLPPTPEAAPEEDMSMPAESVCPSEDGTGTIVDVAVGNGSFGTLVAAVTAADLVETLQSPGPFTVFGKCMEERCVWKDTFLFMSHVTHTISLPPHTTHSPH